MDSGIRATLLGPLVASLIAITAPGHTAHAASLETVATQVAGRTVAVVAETPATHTQHVKQWHHDYLAATFTAETPPRILMASDDVDVLQHPAYYRRTLRLAVCVLVFSHELGHVTTGDAEYPAERWAMLNWRRVFRLVVGSGPSQAQARQVAAVDREEFP